MLGDLEDKSGNIRWGTRAGSGCPELGSDMSAQLG